MGLKPMNDRVYDAIKWIALLVIPSLAGVVAAISEIWSMAINPELISALTGMSAIIGAMLTLSSGLYYTKADVPIPTIPLKVYKVLQDMTLYYLPAVATLYYVISLFMHVDYVMPVVETIIVIQVFLGLILGTYSTQTGDLRHWVQKNLNDIMVKVREILSQGTGTGSPSK